MYIENNTIYFKSIDPYYSKELSGVKSNIVRILSKKEINLLLLTVGIQNIKRINIFNKEINKSFERKLSDISISYDNYIFSWK